MNGRSLPVSSLGTQSVLRKIGCDGGSGRGAAKQRFNQKTSAMLESMSKERWFIKISQAT
jgi:hypothetical protein